MPFLVLSTTSKVDLSPPGSQQKIYLCVFLLISTVKHNKIKTRCCSVFCHKNCTSNTLVKKNCHIGLPLNFFATFRITLEFWIWIIASNGSLMRAFTYNEIDGICTKIFRIRYIRTLPSHQYNLEALQKMWMKISIGKK